ncbi:P-loop containing nucleoside triphosphate hydrolase protein [Russula earlei]|uniref:P-loop containing nucleoside triphosphate hydrolase protein n=1 Tax=Russula earlei TaxID=71964 RepID=A0ACC0UF01_9AGAM|nr:P-loop containing nucleoside triphosphate hydrolase protein [Russula earlei]
MPPNTTTLRQSEIPRAPQSAVVLSYSPVEVVEMGLDFCAALPPHPPVVAGVSIGLAPEGPRIQTLALALRDKVFCLSLPKSLTPALSQALRKLFSDIQYLTGFELPYALVLLAHTLGSDVSGYDLSTLSVPSKRGAITSPGDFIKSKEASARARRINERWDGGKRRNGANSNSTPKPNHALRAWFTAMSVAFSPSALIVPLSILAPPTWLWRTLRSGQQLSTEFVDKATLACYVGLASRAIHLDLLKPRIQENDFSEVKTKRNGMTVHNARFQDAYPSKWAEVHLKNGDVVGAKIKGAKGRQSSAVTERPLNDVVSRIQVIGREEPTNAEQAQYRFLLISLTTSRHTPLFVNIIWFPGSTRSIKRGGESYSLSGYESRILEKLNESQRGIVGAMVSTTPRDSLIIAHGPPGTGKTTTIAAAAEIWSPHRLPCWIIAQSNVGVKNIAETLLKKKINFKLIVSLEFMFEWHEELYAGMKDKVIRSDELPDAKEAVARALDDATVVLCTVSMLSNWKLHDCGIFEVVPMKCLVIDEASQIDVFEFMVIPDIGVNGRLMRFRTQHLFHKFSNVLSKVCFFGDPKQLPPYGATEAGLKTIFEVKHLKKKAYFLNTQYRLPMRLGEFISENVYDGKLQSSHNIVEHSCIAFIDVAKGAETRRGNSYQNMEEVQIVVRVAKRYRQRHLNFCVITFYDPQRAAIANAFKDEDLPTGCVYNVDSFQGMSVFHISVARAEPIFKSSSFPFPTGNEADYVILSSVRTERAGFLNSQPRMNVALTRCRKGMVVVTRKAFLQGPGKNTLLGRLAAAWSPPQRDVWIDRKALLSGPVDLPGLLLLLPRPPPPSPGTTALNPGFVPTPSSTAWATRTPAPATTSISGDARRPYAVVSPRAATATAAREQEDRGREGALLAALVRAVEYGS